jgi:ketosteroid isomerase-like protein
MRNARKSLESFHGTGYALVDTEVQIHGDLALVYYVATYDYRNPDGRAGTIPLRSVDIYRREKNGWNQAGSHITVIPSAGSWGEGKNEDDVQAARSGADQPRTLSATEQRELFETREKLWRAWFANDTEQLQSILPEELIAIDAGVEAWADRSESLNRSAEFAAGKGRLVRLEFPRTQIQVYGDVVILYTAYLVETEKGGERSTASGRGTEIFERRAGRWLNTGWHLDDGS